MTFPIESSPIALRGELDARMSRWLWLVKMFLAVPHFVILAVLWAAFIVTTVIAGFGILFTGRYPRALFDFNVGVMRWNWRVGFYVYAALGTDRYPPFTLASADYPASLEIEYPARLSRGLVLVKWAIALPHIIIVALVLADIVRYPFDSAAASGANAQAIGAYSVLNLLVVVAGFFLLVTGRYPSSLFNFLMGISRWIYRVIAYVALMRDEYPPFRLDSGPMEPVVQH